MGLVELPVGVGRADDPVAAPGDHEQHALLGAQDQPAVDLDAVARDDEVDALGGADLELAALADQVLEVVGPDPGRVDDLPRVDLELLVGEVVLHAHAGHALAFAQEADDPRARRDGGAVGGGGARGGERMAGVVDLGIPVLDGADQRVGLERRGDLERLALGQVAVAVQALVAAELVVEQHPGADVDALPDPLLQRKEERHGPHQVRRDHVEQQAALAQRLVDEAELHLLEVAQTAVDQLARAARGAGGEIARLQQRDRQAAAGGVERAARPRRAAADDDDVERLLAHARQGGVALRGIEASRILRPRRGVHHSGKATWCRSPAVQE